MISEAQLNVVVADVWDRIDETPQDSLFLEEIAWRCGEGDDGFFYTKISCKELGMDFDEVLSFVQSRVSCVGCDCDFAFFANDAYD